MCKIEEQATMRLNFFTTGNYDTEDRTRWAAKVEFYLVEGDLDANQAAYDLAQDLRDTLSYETNPLQTEASLYSDLLGLVLGHVDWEGRARTMVNDQVQEWRYSGRYAELVEELELEEMSG